MNNLVLADRIELETCKRLHSSNAEAYTIFRSCIAFLPESLEVVLCSDPDLYGLDAIESFRMQLHDIHLAVKADLM